MILHKCMIHLLAIILFTFLLNPLGIRAESIIRDVRLDTANIDLIDTTSATLHWRLMEPVATTVFICNLKGSIVRTLLPEKALDQGHHSVRWDGRDDHGIQCPNGVYLPVIRCKSKEKGSSVYTPAATDWGKEAGAGGFYYNASQASLSFIVSEKAYAQLIVGLQDGGPVYKTLASWRLWQPGSYTIPWDGKDKDGRQEVHKLADLAYAFHGFTLFENSLTISGAPDIHYTQSPSQVFAMPASANSQMSFYLNVVQRYEQEPEIAIEYADMVTNREEVVLNGKVDLRLSFVHPGRKSSQARRGSELVLYLDNTFITEFQVVETPGTFVFDTHPYPNGHHLLTFNLLTPDGQVGVVTHAVTIQN